MFSIHPNAQQRFTRIGREKTALYVVDNTLLEIEKLLAFSQKSEYLSGTEKQGYPGRRSLLPSQYIEFLSSALEPTLRKLYDIPNSLKMHLNESLFSLVDVPETELGPFQSIPHADSSYQYYFAILHYLSPGNHGGTGFYRHQPSGFENIYSDRVHHFERTLQQYIDFNGLPEQQYFKHSDPHFEQIASIDYLPNRVLVYPGTLLHTGLIEPKADLSLDGVMRRLTANIFLEFK